MALGLDEQDMDLEDMDLVDMDLVDMGLELVTDQVEAMV